MVVGFESKNYTVEGGQRFFELPVVVQEGELSETVMLMAVTENKSATGNRFVFHLHSQNNSHMIQQVAV